MKANCEDLVHFHQLVQTPVDSLFIWLNDAHAMNTLISFSVAAIIFTAVCANTSTVESRKVTTATQVANAITQTQ